MVVLLLLLLVLVLSTGVEVLKLGNERLGRIMDRRAQVEKGTVVEVQRQVIELQTNGILKCAEGK